MLSPSKSSVITASTGKQPATITLLALAAGTLLLSACNVTFGSGFSENGSGNITTEIIEVDGFDSITAEGIYEVHIVVDSSSEPSLSIEIDDNLHDNLDIDVDGGVLTLGIDDGIDPTESLRATVIVPVLDRVTATGATEITIAGEPGTDDEELLLTSTGASTIDSWGYRANAVTVEATGASTQTVWASGEVRGSASGAASITVKGADSVNVTTSGVAEVD